MPADNKQSPAPERTVILACGALVADLMAVMRANGLSDRFRIEALPADLHNRPERIAPRLQQKLEALKGQRVVVAYADCGSGGAIDRVCARYGVTRLPGDHCYDSFAGADVITALREEALGTFFLTDYMVRYFEGLIFRGMGLDRYPQLRDTYFAGYSRIVYLAQTRDPKLLRQAHDCARRLGLPLTIRYVGYGALGDLLTAPDGEAGSGARDEAGSEARDESGSGTRSINRCEGEA